MEKKQRFKGEGDICYVFEFPSLPANTDLLERQEVLHALETGSKWWGATGWNPEVWSMLILALSCEGWFALTTVWDYLLLCYDGDYMAANWHLPVLSQLIQAEVAVSIRLMNKIPKHSSAEQVFFDSKKSLLRNVLCFLWGAAGKGTMALEYSWISQAKQWLQWQGGR